MRNYYIEFDGKLMHIILYSIISKLLKFYRSYCIFKLMILFLRYLNEAGEPINENYHIKVDWETHQIL